MSKFYYAAKDSSTDFGLWTGDGTALGARELVQGLQGTKDLNPFYMTQLGPGVVFSGEDSSGNNGLWITDGTAAGSSELLVGTQGATNL